MNFEELALEVRATMVGWQIIKPPRCRGTSGVLHRFSFLASDGERMHGFDLYPEVREIEVIGTFVKSFDAGVSAHIVSLKETPTDGGLKLAREYNIQVLSPSEIGTFFDSLKRGVRVRAVTVVREGARSQDFEARTEI